MDKVVIMLESVVHHETKRQIGESDELYGSLIGLICHYACLSLVTYVELLPT